MHPRSRIYYSRKIYTVEHSRGQRSTVPLYNRANPCRRICLLKKKNKLIPPRTVIETYNKETSKGLIILTPIVMSHSDIVPYHVCHCTGNQMRLIAI